jgi:putative ABC transport system permease protein
MLLLALTNIRAGKGQAFSLLLFTFVAALLLNLGLLLLFNFGSFFDKRAEELHTAHFAIMEQKELFTPRQTVWLNSYPGVTEVEREDVISFMTEVPYNGGGMVCFVVFVDASTPRTMNDLLLVEGSPPQTADELCLPSIFKFGGGYALGDSFTVEVAGVPHHFRITGFTEDILFGAPTINNYRLFLSDKGYERLLAQLPGEEAVLLSARTDEPASSGTLSLEFIREFFFSGFMPNADSSVVFTVDYEGAHLARTFISSIISMITMVFAALITLISLIVIRFRIRNSIEEGITNIGALKAVGYTNRQIIGSIVLQFTVLGIVGACVGIAGSYLALAPVTHMLIQQTALEWTQGFDVATSLLALALILLVLLVVSFASASRIRKLSPLMALRQGISVHNFKRNNLPLQTTSGGLPLLLALKTALQSKGQMVMIFIIVSLVSFMAVAGMSIYANMGLKPEAFGQIIAGEMPDAAFTARESSDAPLLLKDLQQRPETRTAFYYQDLTVLLEDYTANNIVTEDFSLLEGTMLYAGRYPRHDNEVAISGKLAELLGKGTGDMVEVRQGEVRGSYLVVGLIQTINNSGSACMMTTEALRHIQPDFKPRGIYVYLDDPSQSASFVSSIKAEYAAVLASSIDIAELRDATMGVYGSIFGMVTLVIVAVTVFVILLVLYLVLKTAILRNRRTIGIQKALGFTTWQLMQQITLSYLLVIAAGVAVGALGGVLGFNSLFVTLIRTMGIMTASMPTPVELTIALGAGLIVLAYAFSLLITWRIRRIAAYTLISE